MLYANNKALIPYTNHMDFISTLYVFNVSDMSKIGYLWNSQVWLSPEGKQIMSRQPIEMMENT
jgi:hypothetical protein